MRGGEQPQLGDSSDQKARGKRKNIHNDALIRARTRGRPKLEYHASLEVSCFDYDAYVSGTVEIKYMYIQRVFFKNIE